MSKRKPNGYWQQWDNIERELISIMEDLGHFPSGNELVEMGRSSLNNAIGKYGGYNKIRQEMGIEVRKKRSGFYSEISDDELIKRAESLFDGSFTRVDLKKKDSGLYQAICNRGLNERFQRKFRNFKGMSDKELIEFTFSTYGKTVGKTELAKRHPSLYNVLRERGLNDKLKGKIRTNKFYASLDDDELIGYAHRLYGEGITKKELSKKDGGLYLIFLKRDLTSRLGGTIRGFRGMSDEEVMDYTFNTYGENITKGGLVKKDRSLYNVIRRKGLLRKLKGEKRKMGFLKEKSDNELLEYCTELHGENITKGQLVKKDSGLYTELWRRKLLDRLGGNDSGRLETIVDSYVRGEDG